MMNVQLKAALCLKPDFARFLRVLSRELYFIQMKSNYRLSVWLISLCKSYGVHLGVKISVAIVNQRR